MRSYRLATSPRDYSRCHQLLQDPSCRLSFPTVVCEEDGEVVGFLATRPQKDMIAAGPLVVKGKRPLVPLRLTEAYEVVLRAAGVSTYWINVDTDQWADQIRRLGLHLEVAPRIFRRELNER